jgi:hypothetical protein
MDDDRAALLGQHAGDAFTDAAAAARDKGPATCKI